MSICRTCKYRDDEPLLAEVIDYGQGYDDCTLEIFEAFKKFREGYYELVNCGDEWWKVMNQGADFDEIMTDAWEEINGKNEDRLIEPITKIEMAMVGAYVRFDEFVEGLAKADTLGYGYRTRKGDTNDSNT